MFSFPPLSIYRNYRLCDNKMKERIGMNGIPYNSAAEIRELIDLQDHRLDEELARFHDEQVHGRKLSSQGLELGRLALMLPLYCQPDSRYYHNSELLAILHELAAAFLAIQLPSGSVSLYNCNIDSPPDTAFTSHLVALLVELGRRFGGEETAAITETLELFMERAQDSMLYGGIHTPNHRWVHASALAKMHELFGGTAFRDRAFQFLNEGLDITEYGEWTERSNAIYNAICAYYLHTVGRTFDYEPAFEAAQSTLVMMSYLLHPGDTIATEYSGRQDLGQVAKLDDRFYAACHLMAARSKDPILAALARTADRTSSKGSLGLIHWMLEPELMELPGDETPLSDSYTVLFGENNVVRVPDRVPYLGPVVKHPHGASVLRHRRGKLSVTVMAGQQEMMYIQYGQARMPALKLGVGWFGIGAAAFPGIRKLAEDTYRMDVELEGCYFQPLAEEHTRNAKGMYVNMPNHLRERTDILHLRIGVEVKLLDDGVDVRIVSEERAGIYLQAICMFDAHGQLQGDGLEHTAPSIQRLTEGAAIYSCGEDHIRIEEGALEHFEVFMRNDVINKEALNLTMNWVTPADRILRFRFFSEPELH